MAVSEVSKFSGTAFRLTTIPQVWLRIFLH